MRDIANRRNIPLNFIEFVRIDARKGPFDVYSSCASADLSWNLF